LIIGLKPVKLGVLIAPDPEVVGMGLSRKLLFFEKENFSIILV
jgi:hypothetical protein